mmetsp:Transcript_141274/g.263437  ORF Transcript_141274/g.263437 Transcript_141274/m.263437 type:complete len:219 (-) Transcript_141274:463-1119(-)
MQQTIDASTEAGKTIDPPWNRTNTQTFCKLICKMAAVPAQDVIAPAWISLVQVQDELLDLFGAQACVAQEQRLPEVMSWMTAWHHARQRSDFRQHLVWAIGATERPLQPIDLQSGVEDTAKLQSVVEQLRHFTMSEVVYVEMHCQVCRSLLLFRGRCLARWLHCFNQDLNLLRARCLWRWIQCFNHDFHLLRARFSLSLPRSIAMLGISLHMRASMLG